MDGVVTYSPCKGLSDGDSGAGSTQASAVATGASGGPVMLQDADDAAGPDNSASFTVYEQFVFGMLRNFRSLPLDRIHNMLKMFVVDCPCRSWGYQSFGPI